MPFEPLLLYNAFIQVVTAVVFAFVGYQVTRRNVEGPDRRALAAFSMWWYGVAFISVWALALQGVTLAGWMTLALYESMVNGIILVLIVAVWGLGYYLIYLFTGKERWMWITAAFYAAFYLWFLYLLAAANLTGITVTRGEIEPTFENENVLGAGASQVFLLLFLLPQIIGAVGYGSLYFRVHDATVRYRIATIALTMIVWFGSSIVAGMTGLSKWEGWTYINQLIGLAAALLVLVAYKPPKWILHRLEMRQAAAHPVLH